MENLGSDNVVGFCAKHEIQETIVEERSVEIMGKLQDAPAEAELTSTERSSQQEAHLPNKPTGEGGVLSTEKNPCVIQTLH